MPTATCSIIPTGAGTACQKATVSASTGPGEMLGHSAFVGYAEAPGFMAMHWKKL